MTRLAATLLCGLLLLSCAGLTPQGPRPALEQDGSVYVYLRPTPSGVASTRWQVESVAALREDGAAIPLQVVQAAGVDGGLPRERLLAAGDVPPGRYSGLDMVFEATPKVDGGGGGPDAPIRLEVPFGVARQRAVVVALTAQGAGRSDAGGASAPAFSAVIPGKIASGVIGLVSSRGANILTVFDKVTGEVVDVIPTGAGPAGIALDQDRRRAFVAISSGDAVEAIDLQENVVVDRVRLTGGDGPTELALTPDGRTLLVVNAGSNTVSVVDPRAMFETNRVPVGEGPESVLIDRVGQRAYVFNGVSNNITVLNLPSGALVATIATDSGPFRGQLSRDGTRLYVAHRSSPYLLVIDPAALAVVQRVYVGQGASALKLDPQTGRIHLARGGAGVVNVYDPMSLLPVDSIRTDGDAGFLAIDGEGNNLFVLLPAERELRTVRLVSKKTIAVADLGEDPYWVASMGEK